MECSPGRRRIDNGTHKEIAMSQNLSPLVVTPDQVASARAHIAQAHAGLGALISLTDDQRKSMVHMGPKSQPFMLQTLRVMEQNPHLLPPSIDLAGGLTDRAALELLLPLQEEVQRFKTLLDDTIDAIGSDLLMLALEGYAQFRLSGDEHGLGALKKELGARWGHGRRTKPAAPAA
jgi:hypothetical protein